MLLDKLGAKPVVARRHGGVGGEDHLPSNTGDSLVKDQPLVLDSSANRFQHRETTVPLVHVKHPGSYPDRFECAKTTDAKKHFLPDSHAAVAAV